jgi:hypothetical protein
MKKQRLQACMTCVLLLAVSGCPSKHPRHGETVTVTNGVPSASTTSIFADEGGILTFKATTGTLTVNFLDGTGKAVTVCDAGGVLTGKSTVTCKLINGSEGDYTVQITQTTNGSDGKPRESPPKEIKAYVRPCKNC